MANHAADEQNEGVDGNLRPDAAESPVVKHEASCEDGQREQGVEPPPGIPPLLFEADNEGKQVEAEGQYPEKRDYANVLADLIGGGEKDHTSTGRKTGPERVGFGSGPRDAAANLAFIAGGGRGERLGSGSGNLQGAVAACRGKAHVGPPPQARLRLERKQGLKQKRVTEQGQKRAKVRKGVEPVRRAAGMQSFRTTPARAVRWRKE